MSSVALPAPSGDGVVRIEIPHGWARQLQRTGKTPRLAGEQREQVLEAFRALPDDERRIYEIGLLRDFVTRKKAAASDNLSKTVNTQAVGVSIFATIGTVIAALAFTPNPYVQIGVVAVAMVIAVIFGTAQIIPIQVLKPKKKNWEEPSGIIMAYELAMAAKETHYLEAEFLQLADSGIHWDLLLRVERRALNRVANMITFGIALVVFAVLAAGTGFIIVRLFDH